MIRFFAIGIIGALIGPLLPNPDPTKFGGKMFPIALVSSIIVYFVAKKNLKSKGE